MMSYRLIKGKNPSVGVTLATADYPDALDYSKLHHCAIWSIWTDQNQCLAYVNWSDGRGYQFHNRITGEQCTIWEHRKIIPMIRGIIRGSNITIHPIGG